MALKTLKTHKVFFLMSTLLDKHFYLVNRKLTDFVLFWGEMDNTDLLAVKKKISIQKLSHPVC